MQDQITEQQKTLQALQAALAEQQKKLEEMKAAPPTAAPKIEAAKAIPAAPRWYEKFSFRGYTQIRHNRILDTNSNLTCEQCDRTIGTNNNLSIRRARFVLSGDINDRIYLYFQPDFASTAGNLNFGQIRDLYFDVALDKKKE